MIESPPEVNVTVGVVIDSFAVNVRVTTSPDFALVEVELLDAILIPDSVGAVVSSSCKIATSSIKIVPDEAPAPEEGGV